jgi:Tfp pilus assembly protein PilF
MIPALILLAALAAGPEPVAAQEASVAPATAGASVDQGLALLKRARYRSARTELEKAVAADPQNAAAHFYLGYALYKIAEPTRRLTPEKEQAAKHFAACFTIDPAFKPAMGRRN